MNKKLISVIVAGAMSVGLMVGCSAYDTDPQVAAKAKVIEDSMGLKVPSGNLVEVQENKDDKILVTKVQFDSQYDAKMTAKMSFRNIHELSTQLDLEKYNELQYWATMPDNDGEQVKVISFTIDNYGLQQVKNLSVRWADFNEMRKVVYDVYFSPQLMDLEDVQMLLSSLEDTQETMKEEGETSPSSSTTKSNNNTKSNNVTQPSKSNSKTSNNRKETDTKEAAQNDSKSNLEGTVDKDGNKWCPICQSYECPGKHGDTLFDEKAREEERQYEEDWKKVNPTENTDNSPYPYIENDNEVDTQVYEEE